jgi:Pyridine nucleotide-disulphide oxidoreductase
VTNPATGRERSLSLPAFPRKSNTGRMLIVGGGPAGLECAISAATLGWDVTLCEETDQLGGRLRAMVTSCLSANWKKMLDRYLSLVSNLSSIDIRLNSHFSQYDSVDFDQVVIAAGRQYATPQEWSQSAVPTADIVTAYSWLPSIKGKDLVIVEEDPYQGALPFACNAAQAGANVTVASTQDHIGKGLDQSTLTRRVGQARRLGVVSLPFTEVHPTSGHDVLLRCVCTGDVRPVSPSGVVFAIVPTLLSCPVPRNAKIVGDARYPRGVQFAVSDSRELVIALSNQRRSAHGIKD